MAGHGTVEAIDTTHEQRTRACSTCGTPTTASYGLCHDCLAATVTASCARQGVPAVITDPVRIDRLARIFRTSDAAASNVIACSVPAGAALTFDGAAAGPAQPPPVVGAAGGPGRTPTP